jgi:hypothetical protein
MPKNARVAPEEAVNKQVEKRTWAAIDPKDNRNKDGSGELGTNKAHQTNASGAQYTLSAACEAIRFLRENKAS